MKYEITQQQYVDFLNSLTQAQATARKYDANLYRYAITGSTVNNYTATNPYIACNLLSWGDITAYLDWSGLRPMTELEFEKACRGPISPVANEYAWGSTANTQSLGLINPGLYNEISLNTDANCVWGPESPTGGPVRVGMFAKGSSNRVQSGATYYGIMEMSGNVWERCVTVGNEEGRVFTGTHGNGLLDAACNHDVLSWPSGIDEIGGGFRGGHFDNAPRYMRVSDRVSAATRPGLDPDYAVRDKDFGGRGIRTVP